MTEEVIKRGRGRPKKYLTEEERHNAILQSYRRPERKQYCYEYLKQWRIKKREANIIAVVE
jgi:hypothetical protein